MTTRHLVLCLLAVAACGPRTDPAQNLAAAAEGFFRGVYGCATTDLSELASPDVRMSYPIFEERLGAPVLEGLAAVEEFSGSFCQRWAEPLVTVHEVVEGNGRVVLIWSYSAVNQAQVSPSPGRSGWGGISVFHFDEVGRVLLEVGEESTPGPYARVGVAP